MSGRKGGHPPNFLLPRRLRAGGRAMPSPHRRRARRARASTLAATAQSSVKATRSGAVHLQVEAANTVSPIVWHVNGINRARRGRRARPSRGDGLAPSSNVASVATTAMVVFSRTPPLTRIARASAGSEEGQPRPPNSVPRSKRRRPRSAGYLPRLNATESVDGGKSRRRLRHSVLWRTPKPRPALEVDGLGRRSRRRPYRERSRGLHSRSPA